MADRTIDYASPTHNATWRILRRRITQTISILYDVTLFSAVAAFFSPLLLLSIVYLSAMWHDASHPVSILSDGRGRNIVLSTLQTFRCQIDNYRMQHAFTPPAPSSVYVQLLNPTNAAGQTAAGNPTAEFPLGPYIQNYPINPINGQSEIGSTPSPSVGWVYQVSGSQYSLQAVNTTGNGVLTY